MDSLAKILGTVIALAGSMWLGLSFALMWPPLMHQEHWHRTCANNLRQIDAAKEQWALESGIEDGDPINDPEVHMYILGGNTPECPNGGEYIFKVVGEDPICTYSADRVTPPRKIRTSLFTYRMEHSTDPEMHRLP